MSTQYGPSPLASPSRFSAGERIKRYSDGAPGVVVEVAPGGNVWVKWDASGLQTVLKANQLEKA